MSALGAPRANEIDSPVIAPDTSNAPRPAAGQTAPILAAMRRLGRGPRATALTAVVVLASALALVSWRAPGEGDAAASASRSAGSDPAALGLLLRLHDLPLGYRFSWGSPEFTPPGCGPIEPAKPQPRLAAFLNRFSPAGCSTLYARLFRVPGGSPAPLAVGTGALDAGSIEGAEAGLATSRELLSHLLGDEPPREVPPAETIGDATRVYRWDHGGLFEADEAPSTFLVWRSGSVVAAMFAAGGGAAANEREAFELARLQQARIEAPTPYTPAEADDTEVALEDPALDVPIYWLGRTFTPGSGFPAMKLADTSSSTGPAGGRVGLFYAVHPNGPRSEGLFVDLWSAKRWRRLQRRRTFPSSLRCPTVHQASRIRTGAAILRGFEPYDWRCRDRRHRAWALRVRFGRVVVTAETVDICATCAQAGTGPYNSFRSMAAVARSLELRPPPASPPTPSP